LVVVVITTDVAEMKTVVLVVETGVAETVAVVVEETVVAVVRAGRVVVLVVPEVVDATVVASMVPDSTCTVLWDEPDPLSNRNGTATAPPISSTAAIAATICARFTMGSL
jgi:hypothetical protein